MVLWQVVACRTSIIATGAVVPPACVVLIRAMVVVSVSSGELASVDVVSHLATRGGPMTFPASKSKPDSVSL